MIRRGASAAALGIALLLPAPAHADCVDCSIFFGNLGPKTYLRLDLADPAASWLTYFYQAPEIKQGQVPVGAVAVDLGGFGGGPGTALVFGDWSAGLGLQGCPRFCTCGEVCLPSLESEPIQVAAFSDSGGVTVVAVGMGDVNIYDFDQTQPGGGQLATSDLSPSFSTGGLAAPTTLTEPT
jgi:hypothetical protein